MLFFKKSLKQLVTEYHIKQEENYIDMNTRRSTGSNMRKTINNSASTYSMTGTSNKNLTPEWYEKNAKICGLVSQHPYMYDRSHPDYMRKSSVDIAWKDISLVMGDSVRNCKERWRNIRTSFARSINVHRASGSNRVKPYYLNNELQFLKKHITPGVPIPIRGRRSRGSNPSKVSNYGDDGDADEDDEEEEDEEEEEDAEVGDENDDDDDDAEDEVIDDNENDQRNDNIQETKLLIEMKHSLSSNENSRDSSALADIEHAQIYNNDSNCPNKEQQHEHEEMLGQSTGDESYQLHNSTNKSTIRSACPPKKRQRLNIEKNKVHNSKKKIQTATNTETPVPPPPTLIDFDDAFLQSLRPEIKHMNFHQKLYFKRRVYDLLGEIFQNNELSSSNEQHHSRSSLNGGGVAKPTVALQHMGLTLQLPKLVPKTSKDS